MSGLRPPPPTVGPRLPAGGGVRLMEAKGAPSHLPDPPPRRSPPRPLPCPPVDEREPKAWPRPGARCRWGGAAASRHGRRGPPSGARGGGVIPVQWAAARALNAASRGQDGGGGGGNYSRRLRCYLPLLCLGPSVHRYGISAPGARRPSAAVTAVRRGGFGTPPRPPFPLAAPAPGSRTARRRLSSAARAPAGGTGRPPARAPRTGCAAHRHSDPGGRPLGHGAPCCGSFESRGGGGGWGSGGGSPSCERGTPPWPLGAPARRSIRAPRQ